MVAYCAAMSNYQCDWTCVAIIFVNPEFSCYKKFGSGMENKLSYVNQANAK